MDAARLAECADCIALGCSLPSSQAGCSCDCHLEAEESAAARRMGLSVVREATDSGGDPRARLYP